MSWRAWAEALRQAPLQAVTDLLRGAADITPYERAAPHEFLLAVLPRQSRVVRERLLGEPAGQGQDADLDLPDRLDVGLADWLRRQRLAPPPQGRKLSAYAAQVCEALQWPLYFDLPQSRAALLADRALWLQWTARLTLSAYRDPEYDYWQVLASRQDDDDLQFHWHSFVVEAGRTRSQRYLNLGLLALARLPLSEEDSLRNPRLQIQALVQRYSRRKGWGTAALEELADNLRGVMARNPSLPAAEYRAFLRELLAPLGEDKAASVLGLLGLAGVGRPSSISNSAKPKQTLSSQDTREAVQVVRHADTLVEAWKAVHRLLSAHEDYLHRSGDFFDFVRALDECARALCKKFPLRDPEIQARLFQWIHLALRLDADNPRLWMLWELALRKSDQPQRAQWVLWEMTRRFPEDRHCRLDLARLLADSPDSPDPADQAQAQRLLRQVLELDPENLHAHSTLAQLAIRRRDWVTALRHAQAGLRIQPDDEASAVLLATAYARRNEADDLTTAIDHLQRFVSRYPGNVKAEGYLGDLRKRQQLVAQGRLAALEDDEAPATPTAAPAETDAAWSAFAAALQSWKTAATPTLDDRLLPLPQALSRAVAQEAWQVDVLETYDAATQREFPLETRLWRYLRALRNDAPAAEKERARQAVASWIEGETRAPDSPSWLPYLKQHWMTMNAANDAAWASGGEWLQDLLNRYQPLPAPLYA